MGRPIKYDADYFSHLAQLRNNLKIKALRRRFGIEGYGVYLMILETLTGSPLIQIQVEAIQYEMMAADFDIEVEQLEQLIEYAQSLGLFRIEEDTLRSELLDESLIPLFSHRKMNLHELRNQAQNKKEYPNKKSLETTQRREKDSRGDDSHGEEKRVKKNLENFREGEEKRGGEFQFNDFYDFLNTFKNLRGPNDLPVDIHEEAELDFIFSTYNSKDLADVIKNMDKNNEFTLHTLKSILGKS